MDNVNYNPRMLPALVDAGVFTKEPFVLMDIGCSLGIDPIWRLFGEDLHAFCFDPQRQEIARLEAEETNPNIHYYPCLVGLEDGHDFLARRALQHSEFPYNAQQDIFSRSSAWAHACASSAGAQHPASNPVDKSNSPAKASISQFVRQNKIGNVDFVKIDTDGADFECAISCEECIQPCQILGFMVETMFQGSAHETDNTFHNIDRFMKKNGLMIYSMSIYRYSRAALPSRFLYKYVAQTVSGQPLWGDTAFLRDGARRDTGQILDVELSLVKLLKLACLYEIFQVPDCAAELIISQAAQIADLVDPEALLSLLTPPLKNGQLSYGEYLDTFRASVEPFFPQVS